MSKWFVDAWNRWLASDPGMNRLRMAVTSAVGVASTLGIEYLLALITHAGAMGSIVSMLLGAVISVRHRLVLYASITAGARELAVALREPLPWTDKELAAASRALSLAATRLADSEPGQWQRAAAGPLADAAGAMIRREAASAESAVDPSAETIIRRLNHLQQLLRELAAAPSDPM